MADDHTATIRIRRPSKVKTDDRGRTVWTDTVETAELELVSTAELKQLLTSEGDDARSAIQQVARDQREGVLARDPATGLFEIISDADLQSILSQENLPQTARPADATPEAPGGGKAGDDLSLVSTQMLRKVLSRDEAGKPAAPGPVRRRGPLAKKDKGGGFDPYDSG